MKRKNKSNKQTKKWTIQIIEWMSVIRCAKDNDMSTKHRNKNGILLQRLLKFISNIVSFLSIYIHLCVQCACTKVDFSMCEYFCFYFSHHFISFTWFCALCCVQPVTRFIQMIQYIIVHPLLFSIFCLHSQVLKKRRPKHAFALQSILMKHFPFIHLFSRVSFIGWCRLTYTHSLAL